MKANEYFLYDVAFRVKERSWPARIAAWKIGKKRVAIVFGKTIHLHHCTVEEFLENATWVKHELCHVRQFSQHGFIPFILKYILESLRKGYYNNKFEVEARLAEQS